jgi:phosphonatase-like hydrolase
MLPFFVIVVFNRDLILSSQLQGSFVLMKPQLVVMDMAGTTVNDFGLVQQAAIDAMKWKLNIDINMDQANKVMGIPKKTAFEQLCSLNKTMVTADIIDELVGVFNQQLIEKYGVKGSIELMPYAAELFEAIRNSGAKVYLNTGFNREVADVIVRNLALENAIHGYIGSDEVDAGRPQPDMIRLAMKRSGVEYSHLVMKVGDTISDLYEGFSAGCAWNIGVLTGANSYDELRTAPYSQILSNLQPLIAYFPKSSGLRRSLK